MFGLLQVGLALPSQLLEFNVLELDGLQQFLDLRRFVPAPFIKGVLHVLLLSL